MEAAVLADGPMKTRTSQITKEDALASIQNLESKVASLSADECLNLIHCYLVVVGNFLAEGQESPSATSLFSSKMASLDPDSPEYQEFLRCEEYLRKGLELLNTQPLPTNPIMLTDWYFLQVTFSLMQGNTINAKQALTKCEDVLNSINDNPVFKHLMGEQIERLRQECDILIARSNQPNIRPQALHEKNSLIIGVLRQNQEQWLDTPNLFYERLALSEDFVVVEFAKYRIDPSKHPDYFSILVRAQYLADSAAAEKKRDQDVEAKRQEIRRVKQEREAQEKDVVIPTYQTIDTSNIDPEEITRQLKMINERNKNYAADNDLHSTSSIDLDSMNLAEYQEHLDRKATYQKEISILAGHEHLNEQEEEEEDESFTTLSFAKSRSKSLKEAVFGDKPKNDYSNAPRFHVFYNNQVFSVRIFATDVSPEELSLRLRYPLMRSEQALLPNCSKGISVLVEPGNDPFDTFDLQLLILCNLVPNLILAVDRSAEQVFPGDWVRFSANFESTVASHLLYSVQAVTEGDKIWLHTHGLSRYGLAELEILDCPAENYQYYGDLLHAVATTYLSERTKMSPYTPMLVAHLSNDTPLVVTLVPWTEAVQYYDAVYGKNFLGSARDRTNDHNIESFALYCYEDNQSYRKRKFKPLSIYGKKINESTVVMFCEAETERARTKALETLPLVFEYAQYHELGLLVKAPIKGSYEQDIAIVVDESGQGAPDEIVPQVPEELCWFTLTCVIDKKHVQGCLNNEPLYVNHVRMGDLVKINVDSIVDWKAFVPESDDVFSPNSAFALLRESK